MVLGSPALPLLRSPSPSKPSPPALIPCPTRLPPLQSWSHGHAIPCSSSPLCWHFAQEQELRYHLRHGRAQAPPCTPCSASVAHRHRVRIGTSRLGMGGRGTAFCLSQDRAGHGRFPASNVRNIWYSACLKWWCQFKRSCA